MKVKLWVEDKNFNTYIRKGCERPDWFQFQSMKEFTDGVDYIGKFENLQSDFDEICDKISKPRITLPRLKDSGRKTHYSEYYTPDTAQMLYNIMKKDIEHFNYKFEKE